MLAAGDCLTDVQWLKSAGESCKYYKIIWSSFFKLPYAVHV